MSINSWSYNFKLLKTLHDETFATVDRAIKLEELEKPKLAVNEYKKAIDLIDRGLNLVIESPDELDATWDEGCSIIQKLKGAKTEILIRIEAVTKTLNGSNDFKINTSLRPQTFEDLSAALKSLKFSNISKAKNLELLFSTSGAKFYRICKSKEVDLLFSDATVRIVRMETVDDENSLTFLQLIRSCDMTQIQNIEDNSVNAMETDEFIQLNMQYVQNIDDDMKDHCDPSWIYPLLPGISPCYQSEDGIFLFPDLEKNDGSALGLVVAGESNEILLEILVQLLQTVVVKQGGIIESEDSIRAKRNLSTSISESMVKGAYYVSKGIVSINIINSKLFLVIISNYIYQVYSAGKASDLINYTTPHLMARIEKKQGDSLPAISPNVQKSVEVAQCVSTKAVSLTGFVANKVGLATTRLGK